MKKNQYRAKRKEAPEVPLLQNLCRMYRVSDNEQQLPVFR